MKKIIRLNEDDLTRIVRRVIIEQKSIRSINGNKLPNELVENYNQSNDLDDYTIREALQGAINSADPKDFSDEFEYADNIISYAVEKIMDEFGDVDEFEITDHIKDKYGDNLLDIYNNSLDN